jgi:hypothetical protein
MLSRTARFRRGLPGFVPEGLNDRSQAIYCLVSVQKGDRPVGHGMMVEVADRERVTLIIHGHDHKQRPTLKHAPDFYC